MNYLLNHLDVLQFRLLQHLYLSLSAIAMAIIIAVPLGTWIYRQPKFKGSVLGSASVFQTIPSLALLAILIPLVGIGFKPTIIALTLYAILPITRNTYTGLQEVSPEYIEAAKGLGFTPWQRLRLVEFPLALPIIMAGVRTATAMTIGIATIAAFIGAGGLGDFITQGLALNDNRLILLGAIPAAILALVLDYLLAYLSRRFNPIKKLQISKIASFLALFIVIVLASFTARPLLMLFQKSKPTIVIASKSFTEQFILADMMADLIQAKTHLHVEKKLNLGTVGFIFQALKDGSVDIYPAYTGTAYLVILHHKKILSAYATYGIVKKQYQKKYALTWLKPFGFNNSQTLAITEKLSKASHVINLSQLARIAPQLILAAPPEFLKRADGYPGLKKVYHLKFKAIKQMQHDLSYVAIANHQAQVIEVFTTDGRLKAYHLVALKDDKQFYPPYQAAPVIRTAILKKYPQIKTALAPLNGLITTKTMRELNFKVDELHEPATKVARDFLKSKGLLN